MKINPIKLSCALIVPLAFAIFLTDCKKNDDAKPQPTIASFAPASAVPGSAVTITGTNFSLTTTEDIVKFNAVPASVTSATPLQIVATVPQGSTTGKITITIHGLTATSATDFEVLQPSPTITSFSPISGPATATVTIAGTNFSTITSENVVKFNGTTAGVSTSSAIQLTTTVPSGATSGKITVTVNGLTATSATDFVIFQTPTLTSFSPASGPATTTVTIAGTNFSTTATDNTIKFNGTTATVTAATATQLTTSVPSAATTGKITITVNGLTATSATDFVVFQPPTIASILPTTGPVSTAVTIAGTNFSTTATDNVVKFNGTTASVTAATATQLTTSVPAGATTGKITVTVNGLIATSADDFTFLPTPGIASFSPAFCLTATTPTVTITGTNFGSSIGENTVEFNGVAATVSAASATELTVTVPAGATSGKISVTVNGITGQSATDFLIGCPDLIVTSITVSNIVGNSFDVAFDIKNIGTIPLDLNHMYLQAYVSTTSTYSGSSQAAGGFGAFGCCGNTEVLLQPNEVRQKTQASVNGGNNSIVTYPYVVLDVLPDLNGPTECNASNNELGTLIQ